MDLLKRRRLVTLIFFWASLLLMTVCTAANAQIAERNLNWDPNLGTSSTAPKEYTPPDHPHWFFSFDGGVGFPLDPQTSQNYGSYFQVDMNLGYRLGRHFWLLLNYDIESPQLLKTPPGGGNYFITLNDISLLGKYRFLDSPISPYVVAGPGISINDYYFQDSLGNNTDYAIETDLLLEVGLGVDFRLSNTTTIYLQTKLIADMTSPGFAVTSSSSDPILLLPVDFGIQFGFF